MHPFEVALSVHTEDLELVFRGWDAIPWADFFLNPRRLRGSDFLMRWSQGVWSEQRIIQAVNTTRRYFCLAYGPSSVAPDDVRGVEVYFERLGEAGLNDLKRPDLLIFRHDERKMIEELVEEVGGEAELPFTPESDPRMQRILSHAILAVECENSLWKARDMPDYGAMLKPQRRLGGLPGLKKAAVLPTIILKDEDRPRLLDWQNQSGIRIHIWHVFYDMAFGLSLDRAQELIASGHIEPTQQVFQAPGGASSTKTIYKIYHHYTYPLGHAVEEPTLIADYIVDKNGHILPYVRFDGGSLKIAPEALDVLAQQVRRGI